MPKDSLIIEAGQIWVPEVKAGKRAVGRVVVWSGRPNYRFLTQFDRDEETVGYLLGTDPLKLGEYQPTNHDSWLSRGGFLRWIRKHNATLLEI